MSSFFQVNKIVFFCSQEECKDGVDFKIDLDKYEIKEPGDYKQKARNESTDKADQKESTSHYQIPTSNLSKARKVEQSSYENVEIAIHPKTDEIKRRHDVVKEIEVVRTFSSGKLPRRNNLQTKVPEFTCSGPHYAVPVLSPKTDIQRNDINGESKDRVLGNEYQVPKTDDERQKSVEHLDGLLSELDVVYKKTKERRMSEYYKRVLQKPVEKKEKENVEHENNNVDENDGAITVGIFAEKDGKMYFPLGKVAKMGSVEG